MHDSDPSGTGMKCSAQMQRTTVRLALPGELPGRPGWVNCPGYQGWVNEEDV